MSSISFDNPYLLLLAVPLIALFAVPFFLAIRKDNRNGNNVASGILHVIMAVIIAFAAAGTGITTTVTETDVYVLADVSYSASRNLDTVDRYIENLKKNLPDNSKLGVVCFGNDYRMITRLGANLVSVKTALEDSSAGRVDDSGTNIISALEYAGTLFKSDVIKRVVLITDGKQTDGSSVSELKAQINALAAKNVHVDAIFLDDNLKEGEGEVQACSADYTQSVYVESTQKARLTVRCNFENSGDGAERYIAANIKLTATIKDGEGNTVEVKESVYPENLARGYNNIAVELFTQTEGSVDYKAEIDVTDTTFEDGNLFNNSLIFTQYVGKPGRTLLISQEPGDYDKMKELLGDGLRDEDCYINRYDAPATIEKLCVYDRIILSNVNLDQLDESELFIENLNAVVSAFGKSLVTFGDVCVQSDDDGSLKTFGDMLPIKYDANSGGRLFTFAFDGSHSMMTADKLKRAKLVASSLLDIIGDDDEVLILKFYGDVEALAEHLKMSDIIPPEISGENEDMTGRQYAKLLIENIATRQSTNIGAAMKIAADKMKSDAYADKRLFLISDGVTYLGEGDDYTTKQVEALRRYDVQLSAFSLGQGIASNGAVGADYVGVNLLKKLTTLAKGNFYDVSTDKGVEDVVNYDLNRDVTNLKGYASKVKVKRSKDGVLEGIGEDITSSANFRVTNYTPGKIRASANTVLTVMNNETGGDAPLYAYWNYGRGKVMSFSANISKDLNFWHTGGREEKLYKPFFNNLFGGAHPEERVDYPFVFEVTDNGGYADVQLIPYDLRPDATATLKVTDGNGKVTVYDMAYANSYYAARFVIPCADNYALEATYITEGGEYTARKSLSVSYGTEYDSFALYDEGVLQNALGGNGVVSADGSLKIENDEKEIGIYYLSLTLPLLAACVVLYAVDIAVRKLKKEDIISLFKGGKKA